MTKPAVRCRCGHHIGKHEVLRTELWERGRGRDTVCLRFRCKRCKRLGETFIPEPDWDWSLLDAPRNELSPDERDRFADLAPISQTDLLDFHRALDALIGDDSSASSGHADWHASRPIMSVSDEKSKSASEKPGERARREKSERDKPERDKAERRDDATSNHGPDVPPDYRSKS